MSKIQGVKSVDFKIIAEGEGVVNWNGNLSYFDPEIGRKIENHLVPKLRNINIFENVSPKSSQFANAELFVSQNCIRNAIFKNENNNLKAVNSNNIDKVLCSILGLVRGFMITDNNSSLKRKSCLLIEDFVDKNAVLLFETFSNSKSENETSFYTKTNVGNTKYLSYGSISIEDLQFIVLEDTFKRSSYKTAISITEGKELENKINQYLNTLKFNEQKSPKVVFQTNYVRKGSIMNEGEAGLLMNNDAIDLIVSEIIDRFKSLYIKQSKGYLSVTEILVDYNDGLPMRIKKDEGSVSNKSTNYAIYYEHQELDNTIFNQKMTSLTEKENDRKKKKISEKKK